ncbi:MAG: dephospho-CoA kinase [Gemmatimonadetes bacterium]|nr:dephospho-CoA kinase [Gemmatimonadota bacterium]
MRRIGLTGNIASGKSSVAQVWERLGARIIDADALARRAVEPGAPAREEVIREFGRAILDAAGQVDRAALRALVFRNPAARRRLEAIVHPAVARLRAEQEAELGRSGARVVVHDIPLLFEVGLEHEFDAVVLVDAPPELRLERLVRQRGLEREEARRIVDAQIEAAAKRARADYVIENTGSLAELEARATEVWQAIEARDP